MNSRRIVPLVAALSVSAALVALLAGRPGGVFPASPAPRALPHAFYLWQYDWTPAVGAAVAAAMPLNPDGLYVVAGELGGGTAPQPDWSALKDTLSAAAPRPGADGTARPCGAPGRNSVVAVIPVIRVHGAAARQIETAPAVLADQLRDRCLELRTAISAAGLELREVQLDLDCPERLLADYAGFLRLLKPRLGGLRLAVTALPCHLANAAFAAVARVADGYTLQVHGVQSPKSVADAVAIMDPVIARRAIADAERLGVPYRLALPTYAYRFVFGADGGCRGLLQPFSPLPDPQQCTVRTVAADPAAVSAVYRAACRARACQGIVWFRLPVKGDDACWELAAIAALRAGRRVACGLRADWHAAGDGTVELRLANHAVLDAGSAALALRWSSRQGDYGLVAAEPAATTLPGVLPEKLFVRVPPPGETVTVAWFRGAPCPAVVTVTPAAADLLR